MFTVLHLTDFALHAVLRTESALAGRPAALFAGSGKKSIVLATNSAARASGVELGMTAPQAVARCAGLVIRTPQPAAEAEARATMLAVGFTLSPLIEATAPGVCTIDLKGADAATCPELSRRAVTELDQLGLPATAGLARTPLLALYAARIANPVLVVTDERNFLVPLPLATADPSPELAGVLANWGLRTLGDLTAISRDEIVRRFGADGLAFWQRAAGGDTRPLSPVIPPQTFSAVMEFEHPIETLEPLLFLLRRFLDRLSLELIASQHVAAGIELTLRLEDDARHARSFRLPEPTADTAILFRALHTHLESLHTAASIEAMDLRLMPARPLVRQQGLFDTGLRDPHGFAETLARVSALVGANRVGTPQLEETHHPDAVKLTPPAAVIPPLAAPPVHPALSTPLRRFRPPLPARIEFTANCPTYLWTERMQGEISFRSVAWPGSGEWWQNDRAWSRLEWDIALAGGGLYRLLRVGGAWFIDGEYD
ncbi:MAG: DNA polymerase Y family protein [Opitutus sp.]|nr:DNA polymerase Y family protein [Opitutus sp.]